MIYDQLHCTLLNTLHMKPRPKKRKVAVLDATEIFDSEQLKEYDFGRVHIEEVQICEMGAKEVEGEIRYKSVGGFSLTSIEEEERAVASKDQEEAGIEDSEDASPKEEVDVRIEHSSKVDDVEIPGQGDSRLDEAEK